MLADAQCPRTIAVPQNLFGRLSIHGSGEELFRIDGACGPELITLFVGRVWRPAVDTVADDRLGGRRPAVAALRTTCALWLTDTGAPWPVIATHLGYRDNRSTLAQHAHITPERDRA
ncbi:hypothetical protein GZH49_01040 [Nocardia terpenica]|uniref:hypothetical protein n=1 Tax=Nocardia terpenica TaxID=455432 RepID=UPI002FE410EE